MSLAKGWTFPSGPHAAAVFVCSLQCVNTGVYTLLWKSFVNLIIETGLYYYSFSNSFGQCCNLFLIKEIDERKFQQFY